MKISAVVFDMDGVMIDSEYDMFDRLRTTLEHKGVPISTETLIRDYMGLNSNVIYSMIIQTYGLDCAAEELRAEHYRINGNYYVDTDIATFPNLYELLDFIRAQKVPMAVVSATRSSNVLHALNKLSLVQYFDFIVCGDMVKESKPSPEGYREAAKYLRVPKEEIAVVEDSAMGIKAAKSAGMNVIGFTGSRIEQDTSKADFRVDSFQNLLQWFERRFYTEH